MASTVPPERKLVIDTNIVISLEEYGDSGDESGKLASQAIRIAQALGYAIHIASGTLHDLERSGPRLIARRRQVDRYPVITPSVAPDLRRRAGFPDDLNPNDRCDLQILASVDSGDAGWLLTEDEKLVRRARRAGIDHTMLLRDFIALHEPALVDPEPLPGVMKIPPALISIDAPFFSSLLDSYPDFPTWWRHTVVPENRTTLVIGDAKNPLGLAVIKEHDHDYGLPPASAKICTFKIGEHARQHHYGELLLEAVIRELRSIPVLCAFVEVAEEHKELHAWLAKFGFHIDENQRAANGDLVLIKDLVASRDPSVTAPWDYHLRFGPGALLASNAFLVPIQRQWHQRLFPHAAAHGQQLTLFNLEPNLEPCGNAIRKVYLCNASTRQIQRGDILLFVLSESDKLIENIGIVEDTLVSSDPIEIMEFAGDRTVYSLHEISLLASRERPVLCIKFRRDRHLRLPWTFQKDGYDCLVGNAPIQSVQAVKERGLTWLKNELGS